MAAAVCLTMAWPVQGVGAQSIFHPGGWTSMAADRRAGQVGDMLTIVIIENSSASNTAENSTERNSRYGGLIGLGSLFNESGEFQYGRSWEGVGETRRSGRMVAQIGATVEEVLPNGDLVIAGEQSLTINGEDTRIALRGRVRPDDIAANNMIASSRLADAEISYDGSGYVTRSARPGLLTRIWNWLGL
ncbi:MAG: flagellar basal body L-ring protein FlgH [Pseudomonadota bacterium]